MCVFRAPQWVTFETFANTTQKMLSIHESWGSQNSGIIKLFYLQVRQTLENQIKDRFKKEPNSEELRRSIRSIVGIISGLPRELNIFFAAIKCKTSFRFFFIII
jgi:hypothetical protein